MKHLTSALFLVALTGAGCGDNNPAGTDTSPEQEGDRKPQVGEWETEVDALPFPLTGDAKITTITIGRKEFDENFANRGNIEVLFDHAEETITIETRKYVFGDGIDKENTFDKLSLWAFSGGGNPSRPESQDPGKNCTENTWKDNCAIYAYYDGKSQPERSGMDFRVHLPAGYRGKLFVSTEDNITEQSYPRRGNIKIDNLCSNGDVSMEAGWAQIKMCRELTPAPTCPASGIMDCEGYPMGTGTEAWSKDCTCGNGDFFGQLLIRAPQPWAANITVDIPSTVWLNATLKNTEVMRPHECKPDIACTTNCTLNAEDEYAPTAEFNYPSSAAPSGAGFNVTIESGGCTKIPFVDDPGKWKPESEGDPAEELRGLLKVCTDCIE